MCYKRIPLVMCLMTLVSCSSQTAVSKDPDKVSSVVARDIVWDDLRIQKLLPGYMIMPAIEPYLPAHFVALRHPSDPSTLYWGDEDVLEAYFEQGISALKSAVIAVDISFSIAQISEDSFSDEGSDLESQGIEKGVVRKWKWGIHPVMSLDGMISNEEVNVAWIGLNAGGQVLSVRLIYPPSQSAASAEDLNMWSEFLEKTKQLDEHAFYKAHGQDLREGFTLVNVYGSVLKVAAEKRIKDGKIQITIQPADQTISCQCLAVEQMPMPATWHCFEPIVKMRSEIQVSTDANIVCSKTITVLLNKVSEFSNHVDIEKAVSCSQYGNISVFNFCEEKLIECDSIFPN